MERSDVVNSEWLHLGFVLKYRRTVSTGELLAQHTTGITRCCEYMCGNTLSTGATVIHIPDSRKPVDGFTLGVTLSSGGRGNTASSRSGGDGRDY